MPPTKHGTTAWSNWSRGFSICTSKSPSRKRCTPKQISSARSMRPMRRLTSWFTSFTNSRPTKSKSSKPQPSEAAESRTPHHRARKGCRLFAQSNSSLRREQSALLRRIWISTRKLGDISRSIARTRAHERNRSNDRDRVRAALLSWKVRYLRTVAKGRALKPSGNLTAVKLHHGSSPRILLGKLDHDQRTRLRCSHRRPDVGKIESRRYWNSCAHPR